MGSLAYESAPWISKASSTGHSQSGVSMLKTGERLVAKVWSGHDTLSRSPKESPPVEKKRLCRLNNNTWLYQQRRVAPHNDDVSTIDSDVSMTSSVASRSRSLPRSILRRRAGSVLATAGGRVHSNSTGSVRRVTFRPHVTVEYMDVNDKHIQTIQEELVTGPRDRQEFMNRNLTRIAQQQRMQMTGLPGHRFTDNNTTVINSSSPPHLSATMDVNQNSLLMADGQSGNTIERSQVNIYFIPDKKQGTRMKMVINVGAQFHPDDLCVKANMSGTKVRVMASKIVKNTDGSEKMEPINERFLLPMEVDPYAVEARLDTKGQLTIEAPLLTQARKEAIAQKHGNTDSL